jgi:ABC-2 type transport system ATP-binding protein
MKNLLETNNITKQYAPQKGAFDISIKVEPGEIVGFIGPNGAGKSTTIRMLVGLTSPDSGKLFLFGNQITAKEQLRSFNERIGFLASELGLYSSSSAKQLFQLSEKLYQKKLLSQAMSIAERLDLDVGKKIKKLSLGNKRKVGLIQCILHGPELLILDEPTSGLDPLIQRQVLEILSEMREQGKSVFLSSHNLTEVQAICDRIIMIKEGRIVFSGKTKEILQNAQKQVRIVSPTKKAKEAIEKLDVSLRLEQFGEEMIIITNDVKPIINALTKSGHYEFYIERPNLETMFIDYY